MTKLIDIPVVVQSGQKYTNALGMTAIKDGMKSTLQQATRLPKPKWIRKTNLITPEYNAVKEIVKTHRLATVKQSSRGNLGTSQ